jgi:hypothetical protein
MLPGLEIFLGLFQIAISSNISSTTIEALSRLIMSHFQEHLANSISQPDEKERWYPRGLIKAKR